MRLAPDSPLALANSRHPITEAGLEHVLADPEGPGRGRPGRRPLHRPVPARTRRPTRPRLRRPPAPRSSARRPTASTGGCCSTQQTGLPVLLQATDADGDLLERYVFRDLEAEPRRAGRAPAPSTPTVRFGTATVGGLFGQLNPRRGRDRPALASPAGLPFWQPAGAPAANPDDESSRDISESQPRYNHYDTGPTGLLDTTDPSGLQFASVHSRPSPIPATGRETTIP